MTTTTQNYDGKCKVTEFLYIQYKVDFRGEQVFCDTVKRICPEGQTYADVMAECYNAMTGAATTKWNITIVAIKNGYR